MDDSPMRKYEGDVIKQCFKNCVLTFTKSNFINEEEKCVNDCAEA
jgi:hypothetical protein